MRNGAIAGLCAVLLAACVGEDRDEDILPGPGGAGDGDYDPGDDGDEPGDDGGDPDDDGEDGDPGTEENTDDPGGDGGDTGDTGDDGGDTDDTGDDGGSEGAPDCESMWVGQYIPATQYMTMKRPDTADEMFCWVNMNRINYQFHGRNSGCIWGGDEGGQVTWPYEMLWDADLTAAAQAEAEAVAAGSPPAGIGENNGWDHTLYADGCGTSEYTVTSPNDLREHWPDAGYSPDKAAGLSKSNGTARMGVFYYDPGPDAPTLRRMGAGLAEVGDTRFWVVKFGE
jgi:hypothetical protein